MQPESDAVAALLHAVRRAGPTAAARVARHYRDEAELALERAVWASLSRIGHGRLVTARGSKPRSGSMRQAQARLRIEALAQLRPDARTSAFEGCVLLACGRAAAAVDVLGRAAGATRDSNLIGSVGLTLGTSLRMLGRHEESFIALRDCSLHASEYFRVMAGLFGAFMALRLGASREAERCLSAATDVSSESLAEATTVLWPFLYGQARSEHRLYKDLAERVRVLDTHGFWSDLLCGGRTP